MSQLHRRLTDEQVRVLLQSYCQGQLRRAEVRDVLGVGRSRFFALVKAFRDDPEGFSVAYERRTPARLSAEVEAAIEGGFIPLTQESCQFHQRVGYHDYEGIVLDALCCSDQVIDDAAALSVEARRNRRDV